jgi:hypothetical protein
MSSKQEAHKGDDSLRNACRRITPASVMQAQDGAQDV